ncbi:MAG TPA: carbohydrate kinase [Terriglobales bacterium]|nr:carbohydrate kinase [Terriglobales bacterium]
MRHLPTVVGLGEILWDLLPSGRQLGGAPANVAYCAHLLGNRAVVASRVGDDEPGNEIRRRLRLAGIGDQFLQADPEHPTGTVPVQVDAAGVPQFQIAFPAAWDFFECSEDWRALARSADAVCFGSLAQRSPASREAILKFLDSTRPEALRVFDVNLRQTYFSADVLAGSLQRANVVKLNHEEAGTVAGLLQMSGDDEPSFCRGLIQRFNLRLVCVTRGANGSLLVTRASMDEQPGFRIQVKDTVGAGDAFTAGLIHELLRGGSLPSVHRLASRMGAWVASCEGAMPPAPEDGLLQALEKFERVSDPRKR